MRRSESARGQECKPAVRGIAKSPWQVLGEALKRLAYASIAMALGPASLRSIAALSCVPATQTLRRECAAPPLGWLKPRPLATTAGCCAGAGNDSMGNLGASGNAIEFPAMRMHSEIMRRSHASLGCFDRGMRVDYRSQTVMEQPRRRSRREPSNSATIPTRTESRSAWRMADSRCASSVTRWLRHRLPGVAPLRRSCILVVQGGGITGLASQQGLSPIPLA